MKLLKYLGIGFGALVALATLLIIFSQDEINAHHDARKKAADENLPLVKTRLEAIYASVSAKLPLADEQACPAALRSKPLDYHTTSLFQLGRFFPALAPQVTAEKEWYGTEELDKLHAALQAEAPDIYDVADLTEALLAKPQLVVFVAEEQGWPELLDKETFKGGFFDGWAVVVDFATQEILCVAAVEAESSESIGGGLSISIAKGLAEIPLSSLKSKAEKDFTEQFWTAAEVSLERVRLGRTHAKLGE